MTDNQLLHLVATALRNLTAAHIRNCDIETAEDDAERVLQLVVEREGDIRPPYNLGVLQWGAPKDPQ